MMRTATGTALVAAAAMILAAAPTSGQVANPLPQALGMGGNYTVMARGFAAPAWNPAGLGMPGTPGFSLSILPVGVAAGLSPLGLSDLAEYDGVVIPSDQREEWIRLIEESGGQKGSFAADLTYAALSIGPVAFSATSSARARVDMAPDVAEVFFFGNAGRTGEPGDYTLEGSSFDAAGTTTFAASIGAPLSLRLGPLPDQHFALGATLKYTVGNFLVLGQEAGSSLASDPLAVNVDFPMVHTPFPDDSADSDGFELNNGSGVGLDVGAAWQGGLFSAAVVVKNLVNTFEWDLEDLQFREGTAVLDGDTSYTAFEERPIDAAPEALTDRIDGLYTFSPILSAGAAARVLPSLTLTGEIRHALEDNLDVGAQSHVGVGAELRVLPVLPVRAGLAVISGGYQISGGLGLRLGPVEISAAAAARDGELGEDAVGAFAVTFGMP